MQQFLRGSLASSPNLHPPPQHHQQQRQQQLQEVDQAALAAGAQPSSGARQGGPGAQHFATPNPPAGESPLQSLAAGGGQAGAGGARPGFFGSLDLGAILDSRPASPARVPRLDSGGSDDADAAAEAWQTARSGGNGPGEGWHTARSGHGGGAAGRDWLSTSDESSGWGNEASERQQSQLSAGGTQSSERELAVADLQLLRISSRPSSPSQHPQRSRSPGGHSRGSAGRAGSASLSDVVTQTFPAEAVQRLEQLRAQLSPAHSPPHASGSLQHSSGASGGTSQLAAPAASTGSGGSGGSGSRQASPTSAGLLPRRSESPELEGLHISRRQAQLLQSAVGRMPGKFRDRGRARLRWHRLCWLCGRGWLCVQTGPACPLRASSPGPAPGNPGESADAGAIQEALMHVLAGWTAHVQVGAGRRGCHLRRGMVQHRLLAVQESALSRAVDPARCLARAHVQGHYRQAAAQRQAQLRLRHSADTAALARGEAELRAAEEAAVRGELGTFVEQVGRGKGYCRGILPCAAPTSSGSRAR